MAHENADDSKNEQARALTEQALEKLADGDESEADALIAKAKRLDPSAVAEVVEDLEEDAADRGEEASDKK